MPLRLNWLPDESVFSLCSRYHRVSGHVVAHQTTRDIFQHHQIGSAHDLPPRLQYFAHRFDFRLGTAAEVATQHTVLPFFYGLRNPEFAEDAINYLCGKDAAHLKYRLGLLTSNQGAMHPLRACPECMKEDLEAYDVTYWHLNHQLPGSTVCRQHRSELIRAKDKTFGFKRFQWVLPDEASFESTEELSSEALSTCLELQEFIEQYFENARNHQFLDPLRIGRTCQIQLEHMGFVTDNGSFRWEKLTPSFQGWLSKLGLQNHIYYLPKGDKQAARFVAQTIRSVRYERANHPVNTLVVATWLFTCWGDFITAYNLVDSVSKEPNIKIDATAGNTTDKARELVISLIQQGTSARQAALKIGVSTNTAVNWARAAGLHVSTRTKSTKTSAIEAARTQLKKGKTKPSIERFTQLSRPTINRLLRDNPDLNELWHETFHRRKFQLNKTLWNRTVCLNPTRSTKELRLISPKAYAWLYRNEREWLLAKTQNTNTSSNQTGQSVDWQQRDLLYAGLINQTAAQLRDPKTYAKLTHGEVLRATPQVAKKAKHFDKLPLTVAAIKSALQ